MCTFTEAALGREQQGNNYLCALSNDFKSTFTEAPLGREQQGNNYLCALSDDTQHATQAATVVVETRYI